MLRFAPARLIATPARLAATAALLAFLFPVASLASDTPTYRRPSAPLAAVVEAPLSPAAILTPDRTELVLLQRSEAPSLAELAQPELRLAGERINPTTNGPSRAVTYTGLSFKSLATAAERPITGLPANARIAHYEWAPGGKHLAFTLTRDTGIELWLLETATAKAKRLTAPILNAAFGDPLAWLDPQTIIARRIPEGRKPAPATPRVPSGPTIQETRGRKAPARTYDGLLANAHDAALFEHYFTSQLVLVSLDGGLQNFGSPGLHTRVVASPDGRYVINESVRRPFSYVVPASRFPTRIEILDRHGKRAKLIAELPLYDGAAAGGVRPGPRLVTWRADAPATVSWVQALDRGEASSQQPKRDAWFTHAAPFSDAATEQQRFEFRVQSITWGDDTLALVNETWTRTRTTRTWRVNPGQPGEPPVLLKERSSQDRYGDPGTPILARNALGRLVIQRSDDRTKIYLTGPGASPDGDRPFVDELDLATKKTRRLWRSAPPHYEEFVAFLDLERTRLLMRRESPTSPMNYVVRSLGPTGAAAEPRAITTFANPYPQFSGMSSEVIRYKRADGLPLSGKLYLPPGYKPADGPLPTLLWAYPREFLSEETAGQVSATSERFARVSPQTALPFVLAGYAVLDDPAMPIIGRNGKQPNDTYIEQLVSSAKAAVDELVRRGVTDPKRVAIGGHSYGAFMTANLLAHSRLFKAGIARSGAYNRTLTPFGFQSEQRTFWQAPAVYNAMSPFNYADKIKAPILLIHGEADNNSGTFPMQSERFYAALKGHGANARYVVLPHESHGYRARENLLHMLWEMETWLDAHVKPQSSENN